MDIQEAKRVFETVGAKLVCCETPGGRFLGYKVETARRPHGTRHRPLDSILEQAEAIQRGGRWVKPQ